MSFPEYAGVLKLVDCYIATHFTDDRISFISRYPETEKKIPQVAAKQFALDSNIPYIDTEIHLERPLLTMIKHGFHWYPAELHPTCIKVVTHINDKCICFDRTGAEKVAQVIAQKKRSICIPYIGIALSLL